MIKIYHKTIKDKGVYVVNEFRVGSWIYVENPTEEELESLAKNFSLDIGLLKDAIDPYEVPRMEIDEDKYYVFTRAPHQQEKRIFTAPLMIAIGENFVVTVSKEALPFFKKFIDSQISFTTTQKTKFFLQIFSEITAAYNQQLTSINRGVRAISIQPENITNQGIIQFITYEGILNDFLGTLIPTSATLNNLLHGSSTKKALELYEEDKELIEDLSIGNNQLIELSKANLKTIINIRNGYSTIMTNNLNRVMKLLTALTILLTIPMIISSFYGMNLNLPLSHSAQAFWYVLSGTLICSAILLAIFIKNKWL